MQPLIFNYPPAMKIAAYLGLPLLIGLPVLMAVTGIWLVFDHGTAPGVGGIAVSICMFYLLWIVVRTWDSIFDSYSVDIKGVEVSRKALINFLSWDQLIDAHYRITPGYIELRFVGFPRVVALNNTDIRADRRRIQAALQLIEQVSGEKVRRTLF